MAFATARMAEDVRLGELTLEERQARATATRRWMTTLSIAEPVRRAFTDLIGATEQDGPATGAALRRVMDVTGPQLDAPSRSDLERLARDLESQMVART